MSIGEIGIGHGVLRAPAPAEGTSGLPAERLALAAVMLAGVYAALYELVTIETSFGASVGAAFWPGAGVTVSVLVLRPRREWPAYLVALFATETVMDLRFGGFTAPVSIAMGLANTAEPLLAAVLLRRWTPAGPDLSRLLDLRAFLLAAAVAGPLLGACIGAGLPWLLGPDPLWPRLGRWYLGDAIGVIVVAPLIISVVRPPARSLLRASESWTLAVAAMTALVALGPWRFPAEVGLPFIVIPALSLVGMRMGTRAAAGAVLGVAILVETTTALGFGPFAGDGAYTGLLVAQVYLATCALSALTVAALMTALVDGEELARRDSLTGLANRRLLDDHLLAARRRLLRNPGRAGLVYIDLDGFKAVNDRYGHAAGDVILVRTADRLRAIVRHGDTVARVGGDEFVIFVDRVDDASKIHELAARVAAALAEPVSIGGAHLEVRASVGHAVSDPGDDDLRRLVSRADRAMYAGKRDGAGTPSAG